jgi:hypothetical protein
MSAWTIIYLILFICVTPFVFASLILAIFTLTDEIDTPTELDEDLLDW